MATLYVFESPQASLSMYDQVSSRLQQERPENCLVHVACERHGGGLFVIEVWDDEQAQERWNEKVQTGIAEVGGPRRPEPHKYRVHNLQPTQIASRAG